jgi:adenylate cyclase
MSPEATGEPAGLGGLRSFLSEARRRRVYLAVAAYVAVGAGIIQVAGPITDHLILPDWTPSLVTVLVILGLPVVVVLAWVFDVTSEGVRRTAPAPAGKEVGPEVGGADRPAKSGSIGPVKVGAALPVPPRRFRRPVDGPAPPEGEAAEPDAEAIRKAALAHLRHELRTPINGIIGYAEIVLEDPENEFLAEDLHQVRSTGERLLAAVGRELDGGGWDGEDGPSLAEGAMRVRARIDGPATALVARLDELISRAREADAEEGVLRDLERIQGAARRLLETAEQVVTEGASRTAAGGSHGPGVTQGILSKVRPLGSPRGASQAVGGGRVLVVDDEPQSRDLLSRSLARAGYLVTTADDGAGALERLREQNFDVVLLDVIMPGMDGVETLRHIRGDDALQEIPVIMLSSLDEVDGVVRCVEMGAEEYLVKPVQPPILDARIAANIELRRMRALGRGYLERLQADEAFIERLLDGAFPARFARRLQRGEMASDERFPETTALCCLMARHDRNGPALHALYGAVEALARERGVELCLWGPDRFVALAEPDARGGGHTAQMRELALGLLEEGSNAAPDVPLRIGLHTGGARAGILGRDRFRFDVWGEAPEVAIAAAREAPAGEILVTAAVCPFLPAELRLERHGVVQVPGHGQTTVHRLLDPAPPAA